MRYLILLLAALMFFVPVTVNSLLAQEWEEVEVGGFFGHIYMTNMSPIENEKVGIKVVFDDLDNPLVTKSSVVLSLNNGDIISFVKDSTGMIAHGLFVFTDNLLNESGIIGSLIIEGSVIPDAMLIVHIRVKQVVTFGLYQNHPNPFNSGTTISFSLPEASFVVLEVFNAIGQKIITLHEGNLQPGLHEYGWNGTSQKGIVSTGVYFYKLQFGGITQIKKMIKAN